MNQGLLSRALAAGVASEVQMDEVKFIPFKQTAVSCAGTANLGGCSVVMIVSPLAAIVAHIPPHPNTDWNNPAAADNHIRQKMEEVSALYRNFEKYFPADRTTWVVSAMLEGDVVLPGQRDIMEQTLRRLSLSPTRLVYAALRSQDARFPGQGTVFIDGRGNIPLVYVEDRVVNPHQSPATSHSREQDQTPRAPPVKVRTQRARSQHKLGLQLSLNGQDLFIPDDQWQAVSRDGRKALYNREKNIYTFIEGGERRPMQDYFLPSEGISEAVISKHITRYCGSSAEVTKASYQVCTQWFFVWKLMHLRDDRAIVSAEKRLQAWMTSQR